ncbi:MAG: glycosyltransferase family 4 protein [Paracoccaceae bacterium]
MTHIAFYAPLKSPNHPTPSGDREMGRNLMRMMETAGCSVTLASDLRLHDRTGDSNLQNQLMAKAASEIQHLLRDMEEVDLWVTYHNYYKAPDLIGPDFCAARNIPYVQIESTRAQKRLGGPWDQFAQAAHAACDTAALVFYLTEQDHFALERDKPQDQKLAPLPPFLPRSELPDAAQPGGPILSVGMMREGDKLGSYQIIAESLQHLTTDWQLNIAGDGPARAKIETLMRPFADRVHFLGQLDRNDLSAAYAQASAFFWPGVNEAFGMVYLEAQAAGLPVVAQDRPGVRDVLAPGHYPAPREGTAALAHRLDLLQSDASRWQTNSSAARTHIHDNHLLPAAATRFKTAIHPLLEPNS